MTVRAYLPRHVDAALQRACHATPIVILDGPRAVGKTTTALRLASSVLALPRDLELLTSATGRTLTDLPRPVLIDEWQLAGTDVLWDLKRIVDADPRPGQFILAGSVEPATYGSTYPLTGRATRIMMRPMTAAERAGLGASTPAVQRLVSADPTPTAGIGSVFEWTALSHSGFPGAPQSHPEDYLISYAALLAHRAGEEGRDSSRLYRTLEVISTLEAQAVPQQRIWTSADITKVTWKAYEDLLHRTHITAPLPAFTSNRLARLTTYPKQFLADTALSLALARVGTADLANDRSLGGRYLESYVLQQLRAQADALGGRLFHVRTGSGEREVDALMTIDDRAYAFEITSDDRPRRRDAAHMMWLRDTLGDAFARGFVMHTGGNAYEIDTKVYAVPATTLNS